MSIRVYITDNFERMSDTAAEIVVQELTGLLARKDEAVLGLATGNSPTGIYKRLAAAANAGAFDSTRVRSFNLDEYVGLPGENAQQRLLHPESYSYFMIRELFGLLKRPFAETSVPYGSLIDQVRMAQELDAHPADWRELGDDAGRSIVIDPHAASEYLAWIRNEVLHGYERKIARAGGIDLQIIGVGGKGHVAFHESGIPFEGSRVLLVKLDDNTVTNAVIDGHFRAKEDSPHYATSMGAELVYEARTVLLVASGQRKAGPVARSLTEDPTPHVPISYGQTYARRGGNLIYVLDKAAAQDLLGHEDALARRGVVVTAVS